MLVERKRLIKTFLYIYIFFNEVCSKGLEQYKRTFAIRLSVDRWYAQYTAVCGRSKLLGGRVDLE